MMRKRRRKLVHQFGTTVLLAGIVCQGAISFQKTYNQPYGLEQRIRTARVFHDIFEKQAEIPLAGELVGRIYKLSVLDNGDFIVVDRTDVNLFSPQGQFKRTIGKPGKGPGEYLRPNEVKVDHHSRIFVLDSRLFRVSIFDTLGHYIDSFKIGTLADQIILLENRFYVYSADIYQRNMAACYTADSRKKLFEFAPPTDFLQRLKSNGIPSPFGFVGALIQQHADKIYLLHPYEYAVRVFDMEGKELERMNGYSRDFVSLNPSSQFSTAVPASDFFKSDLRTLLVLDNMMFVLFYNNQIKKAFLDVYSLSGKKINDRSIEMPTNELSHHAFPFAVDKRGCFYSYYQPEPPNNGPVLPNPVLVQFRLRQ